MYLVKLNTGFSTDIYQSFNTLAGCKQYLDGPATTGKVFKMKETTEKLTDKSLYPALIRANSKFNGLNTSTGFVIPLFNNMEKVSQQISGYAPQNRRQQTKPYVYSKNVPFAFRLTTTIMFNEEENSE